VCVCVCVCLSVCLSVCLYSGVPQHTAWIVAVLLMRRQRRCQSGSAQPLQRTAERAAASNLGGCQAGRHHEPVRRPRSLRPHTGLPADLVSSYWFKQS